MIQSKAALAQRISGIADALVQTAGDNVEAVAGTLAVAREAGLFGLADTALSLEAARGLAHHCASTAWLLAEHDEARRLLAGFPAAAREAAGDGLIAIARAPRAATWSDGTLRGVWPTVGGLVHADWLLLMGIADASGQPVAALVPAKAVSAQSYAYLGGLRGVGWQQVEIDGLAVVADHVAPTATLSGLGPNRLLGSLIGCAESGYRDYVRMTRTRVTGIGGAAVVNFTQVQSRLAESDAELAGAAGLFEALAARIGEGQGDDARARRDRAYIAHQSLNAVTRLVQQMGAMGLAETNPVQRRYRDLRALAADAGFAWDENMASFGRELLGIGEQAAA